MESIKRILVPVDCTATSKVALEAALSLASSFGASVEVLHCFSDSGYVDVTVADDVARIIARKAREEVIEFLESCETPPGVEVHSRVQHGVPWQVIAALSAQHDLIVMGTHGRTGLRRLMLGSVASKVMRRARCPVMVVRGPEAIAATSAVGA